MPELFGFAYPEETKKNDLTELDFAIWAIFLGISSSIFWYSFLFGDFFLVVPMQKKHSSPLISSACLFKLLKSVFIISIFGLLIPVNERTNNLIFE